MRYLATAETLDELLASDDSGLCAGLLDLLALLSDAGAARWVLHRAGGESRGFEDPGEGDAGDEDGGCPDDLDENNQDDREGAGDGREENYLDKSSFDTVTVVPGAARIIMALHVAAGTVAELGGRACMLLGEAARYGAGVDSALLADGMTACWDRLRPLLGPGDGELVKDLLTMRNWGLYSLGGAGGTTRPSAPSRGCARTWSAFFPPKTGRSSRSATNSR